MNRRYLPCALPVNHMTSTILKFEIRVDISVSKILAVLEPRGVGQGQTNGFGVDIGRKDLPVLSSIFICLNSCYDV